MESWAAACEMNRRQTEFVTAFIRERYGDDPADPELAMSEALAAFWKKEGYEFGSDEESFILPDRG